MRLKINQYEILYNQLDNWLKMCNRQIKDIGEQGLLKIVQEFCPRAIIGDDGAVIKVTEGKSLVVTTDVLVEGVHFSEVTTSPEDIGWRAIAVNLSDLAAMGAIPLGVTVGLSLPPELEVTWVEQLYQGLYSCVKTYNTAIMGGDITRSPIITVSITALGEVNPERVISRFVAQPGDAIVVTGVHGSSKAGLELLLNPELGKNLDKKTREKLIKAHQRPKPRLDILPCLNKIVINNWRIAGMDSSDGLADAILQICRCSGVGAEIDSKAMPIDIEIKELKGKEKALEWALYGGEDFELVLCLEEKLAKELVKKTGINSAIIGKIIKEKEIKLIDQEIKLSLEKGFQHFSN